MSQGIDEKAERGHLKVLDGWRGISILAVLAAHLLPLGPKTWELNAASGVLGMALFFCLSGFLITSFLLRHSNVVNFLIRRICRILPLAWLVLPIGLWLAHARADTYLPNFLFYANWPPFWLPSVTSHYWSLCVEMQFYACIALLFTLGGPRALSLLPIACLSITAFRIHAGVYESIETYYRLDEILSGATLALLYSGKFGKLAKHALTLVNPWVAAILLLASTHHVARFLDYGRPYFAAALIGASLTRQSFPFGAILRGRMLAYIAEVSYALYIVHPILNDTWLGAGTTLVKYAKRPLLFLAIFGVAHVSTFQYEHRWTAFGKRLAAKFVAKHRLAKEEPAT
ncbi:MAG: acyltransferase family protein [Steroidobacteraceae bacterium]|jgi:peptidoglycan/LPS O-acetylase OafA/YrhL